MNELKKIPKRREDVSIQELGDEVMVYDQLNEKVHILNYTAYCIWNLCNGDYTLQEIQQELSKKFPGISDHDILNDITDAINDFHKNKLLID